MDRRLARRDAELSLVHAEDAARAFAAAATSEATGLYHVVDDEPVTFAALLSAFADRLGAPAPRRVPAWLAKRLAGADFVRTVASPMPTSNDRFRAAVDWEPTYSTYREGLDDVVESRVDSGVLVETADGYERAGADPTADARPGVAKAAT